MADHNSLITIKLNEQHNCLESLNILLNDELTSIASRRGEGLKEIAQQKMSFLTTLSNLDKELNKLIANNDEQTTEITDLIKLIRSKLEQCQKQNEVNAHAAHQAQLSVKQLKDILIGAPSSMTYDQAGSVINTDNNLVRNLKA
ncbi:MULTISPECIES: flagellar export chaperone FlgN [Pseudoalteromonas]|jgi:flagella synthesis protein FlgN|uniref:Flagellar biosynthesis chaperone n=2 Tax=Pseudoalteromonas TaxID=53246 RepID=Q3IDV5_PSET1|nr:MULTISPECIES: flagellar export chaperone FlgN [Pseudoalteromonas]ASM53164.1 flagella synthesis protein FlgN [Pseudoalteromonas nigrifaciens]MBB1369690.1 flagellar export chaperone FlgN [Pseudoalteromonas sp. SR45-4]MBB1407372.1 flagellar export chaperone FlgN [Pseudoalteromonas sp. SG44-5]MBE0419686.1 flagellar export chaperone FlgN [Pseudoalteromonas nigrifaciens]MBH0092129.1 flagellar export chaperone FlgN [Pseudoalteromonas sp. SCQQ13]|tara:strand:- start:5172 stop:5603 length:432 start_codon:yes stop_codon:yes gene_type:complete